MFQYNVLCDVLCTVCDLRVPVVINGKVLRGVVCSHWLTLVAAWKSNYIHLQVCAGIMYSFPQFSGEGVKVFLILYHIFCACNDLFILGNKSIHVNKRDPWLFSFWRSNSTDIIFFDIGIMSRNIAGPLGLTFLVYTSVPLRFRTYFRNGFLHIRSPLLISHVNMQLILRVVYIVCPCLLSSWDCTSRLCCCCTPRCRWQMPHVH